MKRLLCVMVLLSFCVALVSCGIGGDGKGTEGLSYAIRTDGTYEVTGIGAASDLDIVIPSSFEGTPVTAISSGAFSGNFNIKSVKINDGIKYIGESAFSSCTALAEVTLPATLEELGINAFLGCSAIKYAEYSGANYLGTGSNPYFVLASATNTDVTYCKVNPRCEFISDRAFFLCASLQSVEMSTSVRYIGSGAFQGCFKLENITLSESITSIGDETFTGCASLETLVLPDSVKRIGNSAFMGCASLKGVTLPGSLAEIGVTAFSNCTSLVEIYIPTTVESVGAHAFTGCSSLVRVECGLTSLHDGFAEDFLGDSKAEVILGVLSVPLT
ncbi:MAG: leucine-rich repeat domain-containing protein [Clostridia bacterium]|nr:leucine-rich repeat domain-containing protein [Clostridia bacterium]